MSFQFYHLSGCQSRHSSPALSTLSTLLISAPQLESTRFGTNGRVLSVQNTRASCQISCQVGEFVEVTARPMSHFFWKVNEIKAFQFFDSSPECFGRRISAHWHQKSRIPTAVPKELLSVYEACRKKNPSRRLFFIHDGAILLTATGQSTTSTNRFCAAF